MNVIIILFLIILGIVLLMIEFTILPGITIAGLGGLLLFAYSIYLAFSSYGNLIGFLTLAFILIVAPTIVVLLFKGKSGKKMVLKAVLHGVANEINHEKVNIGDIGVTLEGLHPWER